MTKAARLSADIARLVTVLEGGPGSGFRGHRGRPGQIGGSLPGGAAGKTSPEGGEPTGGEAPVVSLYDAEKEVFGGPLRTGTPERLLVMDKQGKELAVVWGEDTSVDVSPALERKLRGKIVTHNHPSGCSFSENDWVTSAKARVREMRVITSTRVYSVTGLDRGIDPMLIVDLGNKIRAQVYNNVWQDVSKGKIMPSQAQFVYWDTVSREMAKQFDLQYRVIDRA
jgi:hypothetical protein